MSCLRLAAIASLFLGAFCPVGANALAHMLDSAHVHGHENGTVHAHEHDAESHHEDEVRHTDDAPRIAASVTRFVPCPRVELPAPSASVSSSGFSLCLSGVEIHDPPLAPPQRLAAPSSAGRAPPA